MKFAGICGILIPIVVFSGIMLAMSGSPWFEWTKNALSDLGVEGISAFFFNNGLIMGGIFTFIFSLGLAKMFLKKTGAYILAVSSLALIGVGLFPKTIFVLHYFSSATFFILLTLSLLLIGLSMKKEHFEQNMGTIAIVFAIFAFSSPLFLSILEGVAVPEAIVCFPAFIWCMTIGFKMTITA